MFPSLLILHCIWWQYNIHLHIIIAMFLTRVFFLSLIKEICLLFVIYRWWWSKQIGTNPKASTVNKSVQLRGTFQQRIQRHFTNINLIKASKIPSRIVSISITMSQMKKLRHREVKSVAEPGPGSRQNKSLFYEATTFSPAKSTVWRAKLCCSWKAEVPFLSIQKIFTLN